MHLKLKLGSNVCSTEVTRCVSADWIITNQQTISSPPAEDYGGVEGLWLHLKPGGDPTVLSRITSHG